MIEIHLLGNKFRVPGADLAALIDAKPYVLHQLAAKLTHSRAIKPYLLNGGYYHCEVSFVELAKHLTISADDYETVITSFQRAREASDRKR